MKTFKLVMLIVACGLISVSCSNEELSIDNTATESELFNKKPDNPGGGNESASLAVTATFGSGSISGDGGGDYVDGSSPVVNSNIRYGDGVGGGLFHYELSMSGNKRNPSRQLTIDLNNPIGGAPALGESSSSTFLRVGNIHLLLNAGDTEDGFVITRANDLNGEDYRIRCGKDNDDTSQAAISYDGTTWHAEMTAGNDICSVWRVSRRNDVFIGLYHIPFKLDLVAQ